MKVALHIISSALIAIIICACNRTEDMVSTMEEPETMQESEVEIDSILSKLASDYNQMAEKEIAISKDQKVFAQYASPTTRYTHGILGDAIEAAALVVAVEGKFYKLELSNKYVFEDIRPRLADVDEDGLLEFVCIRSHVNKGAGIVVYKLGADGLFEYAFVPEIGIRNRWLNIVAIQDLDKDKQVELAWVQTPHIGGILKFANLSKGKLQVVDEVSFYSNHAIDETNLCLSVVNLENENKIVYLPSQDRQSIVGFQLKEKKWVNHFTINQPVDFSKPLTDQYTFTNIVSIENNCIHP